MFKLKLCSLFHWFFKKWICYLISYLIQCTYRWTFVQPISSTNSYFSCKYFETMASKKNEYNNTSLKVLMSSICLNDKIERRATAFRGNPQTLFLKRSQLCDWLMHLQIFLYSAENFAAKQFYWPRVQMRLPYHHKKVCCGITLINFFY